MIMEHKIGEIFEYNGEWYQCVEDSLDNCVNCCFYNGGHKKCSDKMGECFKGRRSDNNGVYFKKLEKVGEPYTTFVDKTVQNYLLETAVTVPPKDVFTLINNEQRLIAIEIKQTKEDMEEKKLKPFDLEAAKAGKPVCTRDGRKARIVCFDRINARPILALVPSTDGKGEDVFDYFVSGKRIANALESDLDLMMLPEKKEGWVNVYTNIDVENSRYCSTIYASKEEALNNISKVLGHYISTGKTEWEE